MTNTRRGGEDEGKIITRLLNCMIVCLALWNEVETGDSAGSGVRRAAVIRMSRTCEGVPWLWLQLLLCVLGSLKTCP